MAKMLRRAAIAATASIGAIWPIVSAGESEDWIPLGRMGDVTVSAALDLAYVDDGLNALRLAARLEGDFDRLLMDIPFYEHEGIHAHRIGASAVEVHFVYDCRSGSLAQVDVHAAYDEARRRIATPRLFVSVVTDSVRSAIQAVETLGGRADIRSTCERLRRPVPPPAGV